MGLGNFFDNFMGGLAFGLLANNPFFGGMGCWGYGFGGGSYSRVDFETFANPFPNVFGNMTYTPFQPISILNDFGNPTYPTIDFSTVGQTIWDNTLNPDSEFNKKMREYYENLSKHNNSTNYCGQNSFQAYEMPFSSWFLPTQFNNIPFLGFTQQQPATISTKQTDKAEAASEEKKTNNVETSTDKDNIEKRDYDTSNLEFEAAYRKLNITDNRFKKMLEECILANEGRKRNQDIVVPLDVHSKNKNGILQGSYDKYRKDKGLPKQDVELMTAEEMCDIYYNMYYIASGADKIKDDRLALYVFDTDVNMGVGTGKILLSRSGNDASKYEEERRIEYSHRKNFDKYKDGWYRRINKTKNYANSAFV